MCVGPSPDGATKFALTLYLKHTLFVTESLTAFIASHVVDKMCLPCKLMLPEGAGGAAAAQMTRRQPAGVAKAMQSGAGTTQQCRLV